MLTRLVIALLLLAFASVKADHSYANPVLFSARQAHNTDDEENRQGHNAGDIENRQGHNAGNIENRQAHNAGNIENRQGHNAGDIENRQEHDAGDEENRQEHDAGDEENREEHDTEEEENRVAEFMNSPIPGAPIGSICLRKQPQVCAARRERFNCIRDRCLEGKLVGDMDIGSCLMLQYCTYLNVKGSFVCGGEHDFPGHPELNHLCHPDLSHLGCTGFDIQTYGGAGCRGTDCICKHGHACNFRAQSYDPDEWDEQCKYIGGAAANAGNNGGGNSDNNTGRFLRA